MKLIIAPWDDETVARLKAWQEDARWHPYTCPGNRPHCHFDRNLIPTREGWVCACGEYKQDWAHAAKRTEGIIK